MGTRNTLMPLHTVMRGGVSVESFFQGFSASVILLSDAGITEATGGVSSWTNYGAGNDAVQATEGKRPDVTSAIFDPAPGITFDGADDCLTISSLGISIFTAFVCFKMSSTAGMIIEHSADASANDGMYMYASNNDSLNIKRTQITSNNVDVFVNWGVDGAKKMCRWRFDGTDAGHTFWEDGVEISLQARVTNDPGTGTITETLNIGSRNNGAGVVSTGNIGCIIIVPSVMSDADCAVAETLLAARGYSA